MKTENKYAIRCLASGFIVLTLFVVLTFWLRWVCMARQSDWSDSGHQYYTIHLSPLPIVPSEIESDPNIVRHSDLLVGFRRGYIQGFKTVGLLPAAAFGSLAGLNSDVYEWEPPHQGSLGSWLYFDRKLGLIVYSAVERAFDPNGNSNTITRRYAGPEGMAKTADKSLGRFESPIASGLWPGTYIYDAKLRRFFRLNWRGQQVTKGPELNKDDAHRPIQIEGMLGKSGGCLYISPQPPMREIGTKANGDPNLVPAVNLSSWGGPDAPIPILDASGRIDMLDPKTLTITAVAGSLPSIKGPFDSIERSAVQGLFAYQVMPLWLWTAEPRNNRALQYLGCVVAAINRDATEYSIQVFHSNGNPIGEKTGSIIRPYPGFATTKYLLENLHPPVLSMLSEITAPYIEARTGARGLFVLPNSFIAMRGRTPDELYVTTILAGLGMILPSLLLAVILAWLVGRDARLFGFSKNARTLWILSVALFGIPACITYLLMRPRTVLVTCKNCGKPRRPDMERCHRCNSPWDVPELNPPTWRVFDSQACSVPVRALSETPYGVTTNGEKPPAEPEQKSDSSVNIM